jgi:hypothetical protein
MADRSDRIRLDPPSTVTQAQVLAKRLSQVLTYDPASGVLRWLVSRGKGRAGEIAGNQHRNGYLRVGFDGRDYLAHRVAWCMHHGVWPTSAIDHIDGVKTNNRIANLRYADKSLNGQNLKSSHKDKVVPAPLGVSWIKRRKKWRATICVRGTTKQLGLFDDVNEAARAYAYAKSVLHAGAIL